MKCPTTKFHPSPKVYFVLDKQLLYIFIAVQHVDLKYIYYVEWLGKRNKLIHYLTCYSLWWEHLIFILSPVVKNTLLVTIVIILYNWAPDLVPPNWNFICWSTFLSLPFSFLGTTIMFSATKHSTILDSTCKWEHVLCFVLCCSITLNSFRFIYVVMNDRISLFSKTKWYSVMCIYLSSPALFPPNKWPSYMTSEFIEKQQQNRNQCTGEITVFLCSLKNCLQWTRFIIKVNICWCMNEFKNVIYWPW